MVLQSSYTRNLEVFEDDSWHGIVNKQVCQTGLNTFGNKTRLKEEWTLQLNIFGFRTQPLTSNVIPTSFKRKKCQLSLLNLCLTDDFFPKGFSKDIYTIWIRAW